MDPKFTVGAFEAFYDFAATRRVLGSFDPSSLLLHFNQNLSFEDVQDLVNAPSTMLRRLPASLVAHELCHFVQATTTGSGFRQFLLAIDCLMADLTLLQIASRRSDGVLCVPIVAHSHLYDSDPAFIEAVTYHRALQIMTAMYVGGLQVPRTQLTSERELATEGQSWLRMEPGLPRQDGVRAPIFFADLKYVDGRDAALALGAIHLQEGFAKAVEMVRRQLDDEAGLRAHPSPVFRDATSHERLLAEPYFLAHWLFASFAKGVNLESCVEEFCLVVDLALMLEPTIFEGSGFRSALTDASLPVDKMTENPFHTFLQLVTIYSAKHSQLPRLNHDWRQAQATAFQNALLKAAGIDRTMRDLTVATLTRVQAVFEQYRGQVPLEPALWDMYQKVFVSLLSWRRDALDGGAILEDYLTATDRLYSFASEVVPAFSIGTVVASRGPQLRPGDGIGVDFNNFFQVRSVAHTLVSGGAHCALHLEKPRNCAVPEHSLCSTLPRGLLDKGAGRCSREQFLNSYLHGLGIKELRW